MLRFTIAVSLCLSMMAATAEEVSIQADRSVFDQKLGTHILEGNVRLKQGPLNIRAARIEVHVADGTMTDLTASGAPVRLNHTVGNTPINGQADRITYDAIKGLVAMRGHANVDQGDRNVSGHKISVDLDSQKISATGGASNERVQLLFNAPDRQ